MSNEWDLTPGLYRHFKGGLYQVLGEGAHTETGEVCAVYQAAGGGPIWLRPLSDFFDQVASGPRFEWVGDRPGEGS